MAKTETPKLPTHRIYAVKKTGGDKSLWMQIGAAWANQDGKGFSIKLDLIPINGSNIVMREASAEGDAK